MLPRTLTIPALHNVLRGGTASVPEITGELLARATARSDLHAFITVADEIPETGHTDAQPLSGVPLAIKDNINTGDLPTSAGTPALRGSSGDRADDLPARVHHRSLTDSAGVDHRADRLRARNAATLWRCAQVWEQ
jgi:Asp-tRNA(Asn)/Glu-tRNA(Gln) amidotransferase A subunit family amidase